MEKVVDGVILRPARMEDAEALWRNCFSQDTLAETREYLAWCLRQIEEGSWSFGPRTLGPQAQAPGPLAQGQRGLRAKGRLVRLVAEADGQAVANAQLTLWRDRAEIGSLVVAEGYRRQGIATALVAALTVEARQRGAQRLEIGAQVSESGLVALYRRWGFAPDRKMELPRLSGDNRVVYLVKDLTPPDQEEP